jgi:O-methyltransferase
MHQKNGSLKRVVKRAINSLGIEITSRNVEHTPAPVREFPRDLSEAEIDTIRRVRDFTMTSVDRIVTAIHATEYVVRNEIPGVIVECGVWRGGSMMAIALTLLRLKRTDIPLHLFDTFEGMSEPTTHDGQTASQEWERHQTLTRNDWCYAGLPDVQRNLESTGYDKQRLYYIKGKVEETIPRSAPEQISLLRLDTDWYESTKHELEHLFPRLAPGGILIIDDYGQWEGCRRAVDEYFANNKIAIYLNRVDFSGRAGVKV